MALGYTIYLSLEWKNLINRLRRNLFSHITYFRYYYKFLYYQVHRRANFRGPSQSDLALFLANEG